MNLVDIRICLTWLVCYDSFMDNIMFSEHSNIGWRYMFSKNHIFSTSDRWWTCIDHRIERCPCVLKPAELFRRGASSSLSSRQSSSSFCEGRRCWRHVFSLLILGDGALRRAEKANVNTSASKPNWVTSPLLAQNSLHLSTCPWVSSAKKQCPSLFSFSHLFAFMLSTYIT